MKEIIKFLTNQKINSDTNDTSFLYGTILNGGSRIQKIYALCFDSSYLLYFCLKKKISFECRYFNRKQNVKNS